jgi:CLIP-associating protein 1/2
MLDNHPAMLFAGSSPDLANRQQIVDDMVKILQSEKVAQTSEKVSALQEFQLYVREGDASHIKRNFRYDFSACDDLLF